MSTETIIEHLGAMGRMVSASKSHYSLAHPGHIVFFNANIYDSHGFKLWYGDVDLTSDAPKLRECARIMRETIYVTRETLFRFDEDLTIQKIQAACQGEHPSAVAFDPPAETLV